MNRPALPEKVAIQMNDTHPAMAVAELMRILLDEAGLSWDEAWDITVRTLAYTNHTLLPEALEKWPVRFFELVCPRLLEITYEINRRFLEHVRHHYPGDDAKIERTSLIEELALKQVRMANLAVVGTHSTNGVSAIHSDLVRKQLMPDFAEMFPERFNNKTNGVTPRRWLLLANPALASLITESIGTGWVSDLTQLRKIVRLAEDSAFQARFRQAKLTAKTRFADWLKSATGQIIDPATIFDCQVKRIHEYKRQLLNVLHVIIPAQRSESGVTASHLLVRGQSGSCIHARQVNNQAHKRSGRKDRRRPGYAPAAKGRVRTKLRCDSGRAAYSRQRRIRTDLDSRLRSQRDGEYEVHAQWRADHRHSRRSDDRDGSRSWRGKLLFVRPDR